MGKPQLFEIFLLNAQPFYYPGSWIEGVVQLRTKDSIKARAIRLKFHGQEHTSWEEEEETGSGDDRHTTTHYYSNTIELFIAYITLWGYPKDTSESTPHIAPGSYVFPFCVQVPPVDLLPPTCEFNHSSITERNFSAYVFYNLVAYIDIPFARDVEVNRSIRVLPRIPLSNVPGAKVPVEQEELNQVGCCCCIGGKVRVQARCITPAVVLGRAIKFTAEIVNDSNRKVVGVEMSLTNRNTFYAVGRTAHSSRRIASAEFPVVLQQGEAFSNSSSGAAPGTVAVPKNAGTGTNQALTSKPFTLVVPHDAVPNFSSKVITSTYELVFRVRLEGACVFDIRLSFAPVICTQQTDVPVTTICTPTILNPTGQPRSAVLLMPSTKGQHVVKFSFDGMDYRPQEQFDTTKQVTYPRFYDPDWNTVPTSVNSYNTTLMQALIRPIGSAPSNPIIASLAAPEAAPMATGMFMPMAAPAPGFIVPEMQQQLLTANVVPSQQL